MLQWDFLHSFPIFSRGECCVRSGSAGNPTDNNSRSRCLPSPRALPAPVCPEFSHPLTMVRPEEFPPFGITGGRSVLEPGSGQQGRRHPGPSTRHLLPHFSVTERGNEVTLLPSAPSWAKPPSQPGLRDSPGFTLPADRAGTLIRLECGRGTHHTLCLLTPRVFTSPTRHTPSQFPVL